MKRKRKLRQKSPSIQERIEIAKDEACHEERSQRAYESDTAFLSSFVRLGSDPNLPESLLLSGAYLTAMGAINVVVAIADIRRAAAIIKTRCLVP